MNTYIIRVQLSGSPSEEVYQRLHERMEAIGCSRHILGSDDTWYELPHAEYRLESTSAANEIRDRVVTVATSVNANPRVLVTNSNGIAWLLAPVAVNRRAA